mgnify:CR=1 FL=1
MFGHLFDDAPRAGREGGSDDDGSGLLSSGESEEEEEGSEGWSEEEEEEDAAGGGTRRQRDEVDELFGGEVGAAAGVWRGGGWEGLPAASQRFASSRPTSACSPTSTAHHMPACCKRYAGGAASHPPACRSSIACPATGGER